MKDLKYIILWISGLQYIGCVALLLCLLTDCNICGYKITDMRNQTTSLFVIKISLYLLKIDNKPGAIYKATSFFCIGTLNLYKLKH